MQDVKFENIVVFRFLIYSFVPRVISNIAWTLTIQ